MQTTKSKGLNLLIEEALNDFWAIYRQGKKKTLSDTDLREMLNRLENTDYEAYYQDFINELIENIEEYKDIELLDSYLETSFSVADKLNEIDDDVNREILKNNFEVKALLKIRKILEFNVERIYDIVYAEGSSNYSDELQRIFTKTMRKTDPDFDLGLEQKELEAEKETLKSAVIYEDRFDFIQLKEECDALESYTLKRNLINERMIDFQQWQMLYDNVGVADNLNAYFYSKLYYPNFITLCKSELNRYSLYQQDVAEKAVAPTPQQCIPQYVWKSSDTDLLELVAAIYQNRSIERKDGKTLTRKELVDYFQQIFDLKIKDPEGKLTRATSRKLNITPFLDTLKIAFENYGQEKDEKQRKRK